MAATARKVPELIRLVAVVDFQSAIVGFVSSVKDWIGHSFVGRWAKTYDSVVRRLCFAESARSYCLLAC